MIKKALIIFFTIISVGISYSQTVMDLDSGAYQWNYIPSSILYLDSNYYSGQPPFPDPINSEYTFEIKLKVKNFSNASFFRFQQYFISAGFLEEFGWRLSGSNVLGGQPSNSLQLIGCIYNDFSDCLSSTNSITDTLWHHIALVKENDTLQVFLDGISAGEVPVINGCFESGELPQIFGAGLLVDQARAWNKALTQQEILTLKDSCFGSFPKLALQLTFEDGWAMDSTKNFSSRGGSFTLFDPAGWSQPPVKNLKIPGPGCTPCDPGMGGVYLISNQVICQDSSVFLRDSLFSYPNTSNPFNYLTSIADSICDSTYNFSIDVIPNSSINQYSVCRGDSITLPGGNQYFNVQTTTYDTTWGFIGGCPVEFYSTINILQIDTPEIREAPPGILRFLSSGNFYEWMDCNSGQILSSGATTFTFPIPGPGSYAGILTKDGCKDTSACFVVLPSAFKRINELQFSVYPNPARNEVRIELPFEADYLVFIFSMDGKEVRQESLIQKDSRIDISNLSSGIYSVKVQFEKGVGWKRLVIE